MLYRVTAAMAEHRAQDVIEALSEVDVLQITVFDGHGSGPLFATRTYRGVRYSALEPRTVVDVIVPSDRAQLVAGLISAAAHTGTVHDGFVSITPLEQTIDVRSGYQFDEHCGRDR